MIDIKRLEEIALNSSAADTHEEIARLRAAALAGETDVVADP